MNYEDIGKIKKQRDKLRNQFRVEINKMADQYGLSHFQATHIVLDSLTVKVDQGASSPYQKFDPTKWVENLAETYADSTLAIVHAAQEKTAPEPKPKHYSKVFEDKPYPTKTFANAWESYVYGGYGPLTKAQYQACVSTAGIQGGSAAYTQAQAYVALNKEMHSQGILSKDQALQALLMEEEAIEAQQVAHQGKSAFADAVQAEMEAATAQMKAELAEPWPNATYHLPEFIAVYVKDKSTHGHYESVQVGKWYTGAEVKKFFNGLKTVPAGYAKVVHPTEDKVLVSKVAAPWDWPSGVQ